MGAPSWVKKLKPAGARRATTRMSSCYGACLQQCGCFCYDDEEETVPSAVCRCGHRNHTKIVGAPGDNYCRIRECHENCEPMKCHNFRLCSQTAPAQQIYAHGGMCSECAIMIGKITFLNKNDDCPICLENKEVIQISCGKHTVCLDCWKQVSGWRDMSEEESNRPYPLRCPLCRESIYKWRGKGR